MAGASLDAKRKRQVLRKECRSAFTEVCSLIDGCNTVEHHSGGLVDDAALCENVHISRLGISWLHWARCGDKFDEETRTSSVGGDKYTRGDPRAILRSAIRSERRRGDDSAICQTIVPLRSLVTSLLSPPFFFAPYKTGKLTMHVAACDNMIAFRFPIRYAVFAMTQLKLTTDRN